MKKQILKAFLVLAVVGSASTAMATQTISQTVTIGAGNTFSPSTKVVISVASIPTSYTAASAHLNGTKEYGTAGGTGLTGTNNDPSKIYSRDYTTTTGSTVATPTSQTATGILLAPDDSNWK
jgi:hypothetical protein